MRDSPVVRFYRDRILPRLLDHAMSRERFTALRPSCVGRARGNVLELGFGSGLNLAHYGGEVTRLFALEPNALARRLARKRIERADFPVELLGLDAERVPLDDASIDCVVSTFTLCTIAGIDAALAEVRRVLRPEGRFLFLEHGRADDPRVVRWQDRLDPLQQRLGGGCHLNREIDSLVRGAGFELEALETFYLPRAPRFVGFLYRGVARLNGC